MSQQLSSHYSLSISLFTGRYLYIVLPFLKAFDFKVILSVSEQNPSVWASFWYCFGPILLLFPLGVKIIQNKMNSHVLFMNLFSISTLYLSAMMNRNLKLFVFPLIPISSIAVDSFLRNIFQKIDISYTNQYLTSNSDSGEPQNHEKEVENKKTTNENNSISMIDAVISFIYKFFLVLLIFSVCIYQQLHDEFHTSIRCPYETPIITKNGVSIPDDFNDAFIWIKENTHSSSKILAKWDKGYRLLYQTNRAIFSDGSTHNFSRMNQLDEIYLYPEEKSWEIAHEFNVNYLMIVFSGASGYDSDDIQNIDQMLNHCPNFLNATNTTYYDYYHNFTSDFNPVEEHWKLNKYFYSANSETKEAVKQSTVFKLSYYHFENYTFNGKLPKSFDVARKMIISGLNFNISRFEEVYTTENWIVRIYKVLPDTWNLFHDNLINVSFV